MKTVKKSWGNDFILDRNFLITLIIITTIAVGVAILSLFGHEKICQTKNPMLIALDRIFFSFLIILSPTGSKDIPICS